MKASLCFSTFNKASYLEKTLESIFSQHPSFDIEVIVANDGSTDDTGKILADYAARYPLRVIDFPKKERWRHPAARCNAVLRAARGQVVIWQTDDIVHESEEVIAHLVAALRSGRFELAGVKCRPQPGHRHGWYIHSVHRRAMHPFLAAFWRCSVFEIGGWDTRFAQAFSHDDDWFEACLTRGLGLQPDWHDEIVGFHQDHPRNSDGRGGPEVGERIYRQLMSEGIFRSDTGPWPMGET